MEQIKLKLHIDNLEVCNAGTGFPYHIYSVFHRWEVQRIVSVSKICH